MTLVALSSNAEILKKRRQATVTNTFQFAWSPVTFKVEEKQATTHYIQVSQVDML